MSVVRKIGNSKGVILPKQVIDILELEEKDEVEFIPNKEGVLLRKKYRTEIFDASEQRKNWVEKIKEEIEKQNNDMLLPSAYTDEEVVEW